MNIEELVLIRNMLVTKEGKLLISFLSDYVTSNACKQREASEIKGMAELLHQIKQVPQMVEDKRQ